MTDLARKIGDRIRELRTQKKLTQEELAHRVSLHYSYLGKVERGEKNIRLDRLAKITEELDLSLEEFFSMVDPATEKKNKAFAEIVELLNSRSIHEHARFLEIINHIIEMIDEKK